MLAAAPTTPPCFRHWRRSSSLQRKNYFNFGVLKRLRLRSLFRTPFFTSGAMQQGRPANAGRPCCAYWKGSIRRWQLLFRQTQLFQPVPCADDLYLGHTLAGQEYPRPCQPAMLCLYSVYHNLPALDGFGHESPRKCAETTRRAGRTRKKQKTARLAVAGRFSAL